MAPRSSWKGFIKLSLVSVPVKAFTANNTSEEIRLNQLHKECNTRIKYQKVCPEHGELQSDEIVSGYEFSKGQYVVIDPREVSKFRKESDKSISIRGFVRPEDVDPIYYAGRTYYLLPERVAGGKPYALLHKGMADANVHAIASVVISGREQLALLRPLENMLVMTVLSYAKKVKAIDEFSRQLEEQEMSDEEKALTSTLISASFVEDFEIKTFKDEHIENLGKLIKLKVDGQEIVEAVEHDEPKIINLMDALKKSVAKAQAAAGKKMAPSTGTKKKKKSG